MKMRIFKTTIGVILALSLTLSLTRMWATAQDPSNIETQEEQLERPSRPDELTLSLPILRARKIEGLWDVRVTRRDCQTGDPTPPGVPNRVMNMFIAGGTMMETGGRPTARGPALGTWEYLGDRRYSAIFRFFRFEADGAPAGYQKVTRTIELNRQANEFTATASFEVYDVNDNLTQSGCATETATRLD